MRQNVSKYEKNLRWVFLETILTSIGAGFSVSTITVFWNSIGMNQTQIGLVQMFFTIIILFLDIPMGYVADRFDRRKLNIIGDIGIAFTFVFYAYSKNMIMTVIAECFLGVFMAMTNGVDQAFLKHNADKIDPEGRLFKRINNKVYTWRYITSFIVILLGGIIGHYSLSLTIGISFIPYFIGGLCAFKIKDYEEKLEVNHKNPIVDLLINGKSALQNRTTRANLFVAIVGRELTHCQIWIFTPLLMKMGYAIEVASIGWIVDSIMKIIGSKFANRCIKWKTSSKFIIIIIIEFAWIVALVFKCTSITVWLFALNGFVVGLTSGTLITPVQESCDNKLQSTVVSIMSTGGRLLYIPSVFIINYLGNIKLQLGLVGVLIIFVPLGIIGIFLLKNVEKHKEIIKAKIKKLV